MGSVRRGMAALALGLGVFIAPGATHAGGGVGGGGSGGLLLNIDHLNPPGHNYGYLDYFSRNVTVQPGQVITWQNVGQDEPHTVTILPAGTPFNQQGINHAIGSALNPAAPDPDDGAKAQPVQHISMFSSLTCGNSPWAPGTGPCLFTGTTPLNSGLLINGAQGRNPHFSIRVDAAPGVYHYICLIHGPAMSGTITVVPAGHPVDTQLSVDQRAATQAQWATRNALAYEASVHPPSKSVGGHTQWTVYAGAQHGRVAINEFLPTHLTTKAGDSVTWLPGGVLGGFHTVTFPNNSGAISLTITCEGPSGDRSAVPRFAGCVDNELGLGPAAFPSGPSGKAYTGGFYGSGILVIPKPHSWSAYFPKSGTFTYECLIHPGMDATLTAG